MKTLSTAEALRMLLHQIDYRGGRANPYANLNQVVSLTVLEICDAALATAPPVLTGTD